MCDNVGKTYSTVEWIRLLNMFVYQFPALIRICAYLLCIQIYCKMYLNFIARIYRYFSEKILNTTSILLPEAQINFSCISLNIHDCIHI
jgi:hypothetical protein